MADFTMPALGADMESGTLVAWKVKPGDRVKKGQLIATVETVKGAIEVEVFVEGVVEALLVTPGTVVPVGAAMARLTLDGAPAQPEPSREPPPSTPDVAGPEVLRADSGTGQPERAGVLEGPAPAERRNALQKPSRLRVSPVARRMAESIGVDLATVRGSGEHGEIVRADVEAAAQARAAPAPTPALRPKPAFDVASMRQAIAHAMARSKREIPHYYLGAEIELTKALRWLDERNESRSAAERILPAALLLKATATALVKVPELNGTFEGGAFHPAASVHLGVAVHLRAGGLLSPALLDAQALGVEVLMARLADLVARARDGGLTTTELSSCTATVTNLGDLGVTSVFPVIVPPQVAMVGFGRVALRPWVVDGAIGPRPIVVASLAADHRVSDGRVGARFLTALEALLQTPEAL
jgi:pyruvate dehydrogenase E2 component (dihydrolipoamide acetyltransferase)